MRKEKGRRVGGRRMGVKMKPDSGHKGRRGRRLKDWKDDESK